MKKALLALAVASSGLMADEGMWMPQQMPEISKQLTAAGLKIDPNNLTSLTEFPLGAIISLGNCTASFVSPNGLAVTNHHCAYGSIQFNSKPERNLLHDGFLAKTFEEELPAAPGSRIYVTTDVTDVSSTVIDKATNKLTGKKRNDAIEANRKKIVAECEKDVGHRCDVYTYFGGLKFYLIKQMEVRDVRLVHAPAEGVGKFGGDTDNWMWPRQTGDYSFYRAYVGKDGKPADFSKDNVPYQPKHHLRLATDPLNEGDFVMVTGYPGRTNRHRLPSEVAFMFGWRYPAMHKTINDILDIIANETKDRKDAEIKYASTVASLNNSEKNFEGQLEGFKKSGLQKIKDEQHAGLMAWVNGDKARKKMYAADLAKIEKLIAERDGLAKREYWMGFLSQSQLLSVARRLNRLAVERIKPDMERESGFQDRDLPRIKQSLQTVERRFDVQVDKALLTFALTNYAKQPAAERDTSIDAAFGIKDGMSDAEIKAKVDSLYAATKLHNADARLNWFEKSAADFKSSNDSFIRIAVAMLDGDIKREARDKELAGNIQMAYSNYMRALIAYLNANGKAVFPDANSTLRITYGNVKNRERGDGMQWNAFTTLRGIQQKATGEGEFEAPQAQLDAIKARQFGPYAVAALDSVPVNFLSTLDITGGNSGSPTLNAKGEFVGLAFDGTLDSVISDWYFDPAITRTIHCDWRYMMWQMRYVDKAENLLKEMNAW